MEMMIDVELEIAADFLSPFEDNLDLLIMGDDISDEEASDVEHAINAVRRSFSKIPEVSGGLAELQTVRFKTSEIFRGRASEHLDKKPCVAYVGKELSETILSVLSVGRNKPEELEKRGVDPLDAILVEKFLLEPKQDKFLFNTSQTSEASIRRITAAMDSMSHTFNYLITDNLLAIWVYQKKSNWLAEGW